MGLNKVFLNLLLLSSIIFFTAFFFALAGLFYVPLIIGGAGLLFLFLQRKLRLGKISSVMSRWELLALVIISLFSFFIFSKSAPSYFEGRDPGAMVEAGVMLANGHSLEFAPASLRYFNAHDSNSLALNYPGFVLTEDQSLKTQFNVGYVSYIAFWYGLFDETGLRIANIWGLIIGLLAVFYIVKSITASIIAAIGSLPLLILSFPFFFFTRQNYSEPMAFGFLFATIYLVMEFQRKRKSPETYAYLSLLTMFCFILIRAEAIFIAPILVGLLLFIAKRKKISLRDRKFIGIIVFLSLVFIVYSLTILPFYKKMVKDLIGYRQGQVTALQFSLGQSIREMLIKISYIFRVFTAYGLPLILFLGLGGIIRLLLRLRNSANIKLTHFIPIILGGPFFLYFLNPMIAMDHPWLLRRFMFAVLPLLVIYSAFFLFTVFGEARTTFVLMALLVIFQINIFFDYGFKKDNPALIRQVEALSRKFNKNDLILIDKSSAFDDWTLISAPLRYLFDKNAVYVYNADALNKVPPHTFSNIYLISLPRPAGKYMSQYRSVSEETYTFTTDRLSVAPFDKEAGFSKTVNIPHYSNDEKTVTIYKLTANHPDK